MKVYHTIPSQFRPPLGSAQLQYAEAFDSEFTLWLGERKSTSLADMMNDPIEVDIKLIYSREKRREEETEGRIKSSFILFALLDKRLGWI